MASPVVESVGTGSDSGTATSVTITAPTGITDDDLLVAVIGRGAASGDTLALSGWTQVFFQAHDGGATDVLWKKAASESGNYTFTWTAGSTAYGGILRISAWEGTTPFIGTTPTAATGNNTTPDPPASATVTSDDYLAIAIAHQEGKATSRYTTISGYTEQIDIGVSGGGAGSNYGGIGVFTKAFTGTTDNPGTTTSTVSDDWLAQTLLIAPAAASGFTGTVAATMGAATASTTGTVTEPAITGTATPTLGAATASASGSVVESITGTVGVTLAAATSTASGTHTPPGFTGTVGVTLGAATSTANGTVVEPPITGTVGVTLGAATATASGTAAITPYTLLDADSGSSLTTFSTASATPTADALQLLVVRATDDTSPDDPTVDGSAQGITWQLVASTPDTRRIWLYVGVPSSPSTGSTDITFSEVTNECTWEHTEWTDRLNTGNGLDALAQVTARNQTGLASSVYLKLQEWADEDDSIGYAAFLIGTNAAITPNTGWTAISDIVDSGATVHTQYAETENYKAGASWSGSIHTGGIAVELLPLASPVLPGAVQKPVILEEFNTGSGTGGSTASYATTAGSLLLAVIEQYRAAGSPTSPTAVTGNNVTWTEIGNEEFATVASPTRRVSLWAAKSDGTTGALTTTFSSTGSWFAAVYEIEDVTDTSLASDDVVQIATNAADTVTTIAATLSAFASADNGTLAFVRENGTPSIYIEVEDGISLTNQRQPGRFWSLWQFSNNTTPGVAVMDSGHAAILAIEIDPVAVGAITGTATPTLAAATSTASGTHTPPGFSGTVAVTLGAATATASGTVTEPAISGTVAVTLGAATASASGTVTEPAITGTVAVTLGAATSTASGTNTPSGFSGSVAVTLGAATATTSGTVTEPPITGTVGVTLGAATATASGSAGVDAVTGNINVTLAAATTSASGTVTEPAITGTAAVTLGAATGSANGLNVLDITGTITVTLGAATATAVGTHTAPYWWEYNPVAATTSTPAHTKTPVSYTPVHGEDQSPW